MGAVYYKKAKVKKYIIMVLIGVSLIFQNSNTIQAEQISYVIGSGKEMYHYQQLMSLYELNSATYARSSIAYQIEAINGILATDNYNNLNTQYIEALEIIAQLNMKKDQLVSYKNTLLEEIKNGNADPVLPETIQDIDVQIAAIDTQLVQYSGSANVAATNVSDAKLQEDISSFYTMYQQVLTSESQKVLKHNFLKLELGLIINKENTDYYKANGKYLDLLYKVEKIKYEHGMSTQSNINKINAKILKNNNSISEQEYAYSETINSIKMETNISENPIIQYDFSLFEKSYNIEQITQNFIGNNSKYLQLRHLERSYQNYLNTNNNLNPLINQQVQYKITDYKMQADILKNQISAYVKSTINTYHNAFGSMSAAKADLQILNDNLKIEQAKLNNKRGTEVGLSQAYAEREAGEISYYQSCIEIILWENILENGIYIQ